jgi:hypothetical protein
MPLTALFKYPYPLPTDPVANGAANIQALADRLEALSVNGPGWASMVGVTNWGGQAGFGAPQYRLIDGFCHLRGAFRRSGGNIGSVENMCNVPVPVPAQYTDTNALNLSVILIATGSGPTLHRGSINPRIDGFIRIINPGAVGVNLVLLDGLCYPTN